MLTVLPTAILVPTEARDGVVVLEEAGRTYVIALADYNTYYKNQHVLFVSERSHSTAWVTQDKGKWKVGFYRVSPIEGVAYFDDYETALSHAVRMFSWYLEVKGMGLLNLDLRETPGLLEYFRESVTRISDGASPLQWSSD